ncbi:hypothetical protein CCACVL1_15948 [Corchorus capsularis]|uniref:Uncharacterized protein n=1 Tax=Corchorus capsularis TaxID=210143 RepID=A0A1R3I0F3_COCAP|nr:hypothetical protein CCACVL1_15948 [Corchorus capsularis]
MTKEESFMTMKEKKFKMQLQL